ncbi:MAG: phosphoserine phosphatase [Myxococcales bacterium]|nr:phosphoserine phosphatase [Myxococcales bacterium]
METSGPTKRFSTKFIVVAGSSVLVGLLLTMGVAVLGIDWLGKESSREIKDQLSQANSDFLRGSLDDHANQVTFRLESVIAELNTFAQQAQVLYSDSPGMEPFSEAASGGPFADQLTRQRGGWYQNGRGEPAVVTVWPYLLSEEGAIPEEVQREVSRTAALDMIMPALFKHGAAKLALYYTGPQGMEFTRMVPNFDLGSAAASKGAEKVPFWSGHFPGIMDSWRDATRDPGSVDKGDHVVVVPPYYDKASSNVVMTFFQPVWSADRTGVVGGVGLDLTLAELITYIEDIRLAETGFAFLCKTDGNILAINDDGARVLGLASVGEGDNGEKVEVLSRFLKDSKNPNVRTLALPDGPKATYGQVEINGREYVLSMRQLKPLRFWQGPQAKTIKEEAWVLGLVEPSEEVFASMLASQESIAANTQLITSGQLAVALLTLLAVLLGVYVVSRRMTLDLVALTKGAEQMMLKRYDVQVKVISDDEIGYLSNVFNKMAQEIREHTLNLESLVRQRTSELEDANVEILALNDRLKEENVRLGAELDVARRLQLMVLPHSRELDEIQPLDIAGFMQPADEVGGDYYDVLRGRGVLKIGIGDVTGHGLESGVLMLMVQTAVRTLLLSDVRDPHQFLNVLNKVVYQNVQRINMDRTLTLSLIDYEDGRLRLTGQHEELLIARHDGRLERIDTMELGFPVGLEFDISDFIAHVDVELTSGDVVVLYTDGITEAEDKGGDFYGIERLCEVLLHNRHRRAAQIKEAIIGNVLSFIGDGPIHDDITVVVIKQR